MAEFTDDVQWYKTTKERINELASPDWHLTGTTDDQAKKDWIDIAEEELKEIDSELQSREKVMQFDGPHDKAGAIITIQAGAGGTDAMDWAEMLERMYSR